MTEDRDDLPKEFDLIVVGTGLTESIVAAAASRVGKSVLHLDVNEYYGSYWASFNLKNLQDLLRGEEQCGVEQQQKEMLESNGIQLWRHNNQVQNVQMSWHIPETEAEVEERQWTQERVMKDYHKFNIDLAPKLLFSRGSMVELLISSNICRYAEFRSVDRIATLFEGDIKTVPCSRADVFNTKEVSMVEKRVLMKMLETCMQCEEGNEEFEYNRESTFVQYLESKRLPPKLVHYLLEAISMATVHTPFEEGITRVRRFIDSLGRYGNTPFLFPMYGCGELPQCFCRLCAVFGGIYCLRRPIERIDVIPPASDGGDNGERRRLKLLVGEQEIATNEIVFGSGSVSITGDYQNRSCLAGLPEVTKTIKCGNMSRGIFVVDSPLGGKAENTGGGGVALLKLPPAPGVTTVDKQGAFVIQLSHQSGTCPPGLYLIHITCDAEIDPRLDLQPYVDQILTFEEEKEEEESPQSDDDSDEIWRRRKPRILFSLYFTIPQCYKCDNYDKLPAGIHLACGPYLELDYDTSILQGRELFTKIYPEDEFLPRCPEPEEIIL